MFDVCYVHKKKNPKHNASGWENASVWKVFKDLKSLKKSKLFSKPCDMESPVYVDQSDYCPICTRQTPEEPIPDESIMWNCLWCKDGINCLVPEDWYSNASLDSHINYIVSHVNGRPLIFQYWDRNRYDENDYNACMEEVRSIVEEIRKDNDIGFVRKPIQDDKYIEEFEKSSPEYASDGFSAPNDNDLNVVIDILRDLAEHCFEEYENTKSKDDEQKYKLFDRVANFLESMMGF